MLIKTLIEDIPSIKIDSTLLNTDIQSITCDSREVNPQSLFVALKGTTLNGADFIPKAIEKGAPIIVTAEEKWRNASAKNGFIIVDDPNAFLRLILKKFYDNPSEKVKTIGITGTNGKTTTSYLIEAILGENGRSSGIVGTINRRIGKKAFSTNNTTPGLIDNQKFLADLVREGIDYCVMEVSSHALDQRRVDLIDFYIAIFTNLTSDHLDYHKTKENYFAAKAKLFIDLSPQSYSVINVDDPYGQKLISKTSSKILRYGIKNNADVMAKDIQMSISGTQFKLFTPQGEMLFHTRLIGDYNIYNILAAASVGIIEQISLDKIREAVAHLGIVPGRLERVDCQQDFSVFIDYAHTQDAMENVLRTIRQTCDSRIILVFGCGGDRDKTKRPAMGRVASQMADICIVTSDNSRSEDPEAIINDIIPGFERDNYSIVINREEAIHKALSMAQPNDVVLIAGKGHETYQIFKDRTIKFDERQIVKEFLNAKCS